MKKLLLTLAAVIGTFASAAAQSTTSTNSPAPPPPAQMRQAAPITPARLEMISRVTEETLGSDFDADAILAAWQENVAKLNKEVGAMENTTTWKKSGSPRQSQATPSLPAPTPIGPAGAPSGTLTSKTLGAAAATAKENLVAWIDETRAALQKALDRLDAIRASLSTH